jgi:hypothetical protein
MLLPVAVRAAPVAVGAGDFSLTLAVIPASPTLRDRPFGAVSRLRTDPRSAMIAA